MCALCNAISACSATTRALGSGTPISEPTECSPRAEWSVALYRLRWRRSCEASSVLEIPAECASPPPPIDRSPSSALLSSKQSSCIYCLTRAAVTLHVQQQEEEEVLEKLSGPKRRLPSFLPPLSQPRRPRRRCRASPFIVLSVRILCFSSKPSPMSQM